MTDEVKFTNEQWDALAEAAEVFAVALDEERKSHERRRLQGLGGRLRRRYRYNRESPAVVHGEGPDSFAGSVRSEADYLRWFATQCRNAKTELGSEDASNTLRFQMACGPA